jgi:polyketide biosynthesis acyl carrier protein
MPTKNEIFELILKHVHEVLPDLKGTSIGSSDSLRELGANSIDRADIVMGVMDDLSLEIPRIELLGPNNLGELVDLIHAKAG